VVESQIADRARELLKNLDSVFADEDTKFTWIKKEIADAYLQGKRDEEARIEKFMLSEPVLACKKLTLKLVSAPKKIKEKYTKFCMVEIGKEDTRKIEFIPL